MLPTVSGIISAQVRQQLTSLLTEIEVLEPSGLTITIIEVRRVGIVIVVVSPPAPSLQKLERVGKHLLWLQ